MMPSGFRSCGNLSFINLFFKKVPSAGLNSLRKKGNQILVKNWIFDDPFHKKGLFLIIWVLGMI